LFFLSALIDLADVTIPENIDSKIDAITTELGFDSTVETIQKKVPPIVSSNLIFQV
jgi:6-phosphofructokinase